MEKIQLEYHLDINDYFLFFYNRDWSTLRGIYSLLKENKYLLLLSVGLSVYMYICGDIFLSFSIVCITIVLCFFLFIRRYIIFRKDVKKIVKELEPYTGKVVLTFDKEKINRGTNKDSFIIWQQVYKVVISDRYISFHYNINDKRMLFFIEKKYLLDKNISVLKEIVDENQIETQVR